MPSRSSGRLPVLLAAPAGLALLFLLLPLVGLLVRAPWDDAGTVLGSRQARQALGLSLVTATVSMVLAVLLGVPLAWLLARPGVSSVVIGARTEEQLADNLAAADLELGDEEVARLERASRPPLPYPLWHQVASATDRLGAADRAVLEPHLTGA